MCDLYLNDDGEVDNDDVNVVERLQRTCNGNPAFHPAADLNGDGCGDDMDLGLILTQVPVTIDRNCDGQVDASNGRRICVSTPLIIE